MCSRLVPHGCIALVAALAAGCGSAATGAPASHQPRGLAAAGLNGVYRMNVSAAAVARHDHVPLAEAMAENYGDFTLVVRDGRFAFTQRNPNACTWQYGRLRVNGDRMDWFFTDGGGRGPNNAANKPGEHFIWKATLYRGALTMRPVTPADLMGQAWHRVGAAPTIRALAAACRPPVTALPR